MQQQQPQQQQPVVVKPEARTGSAYASRHQAAEQRRRTRINERLDKLRELVPHAERANTAAFLETVIEYVQELQALLKCGASHGTAAGKPPPVTAGGGVPLVHAVSAAGSGPFGVATPGGGFEVLQSPGGGSVGVPATVVSTLGLPASLPFFPNGNIGTPPAFQANMLQGAGGSHPFFQTAQSLGSGGSGQLTHHAFANPQQLASSSSVGQMTAASAALAQSPQPQQQQQAHFDAAQQLAVQQMLASARSIGSSGTVSGTAGTSIDQLYLQAATQLNAAGSGFGSGAMGALTASPMTPVPDSAPSMQLPSAGGTPTGATSASRAVSMAGPGDRGGISSDIGGESPLVAPALDEASRKRSADLALGGGGTVLASGSPPASDSEAGTFGGTPAPKRKRTPSRSHT